MSCLWSITSFTFYLGKFQLTHVAGSIFTNSFFSSAADTLARPFGFWLYRRLNTRQALTFFFGLSALGSLPIMFSETASENFKNQIVPYSLFVMNLGTSATFGNLYLGHMDLFPIVFSSTSMGICNIIARIVTSVAPIVAEIDQPTPEIIFSTLCFLALILSLFVREKTAKYY